MYFEKLQRAFDVEDLWPPFCSQSALQYPECDDCAAFDAVLRFEGFIQQIRRHDTGNQVMDYTVPISETLRTVVKALISSTDHKFLLTVTLGECLLRVLKEDDVVPLYRSIIQGMELERGLDDMETQAVHLRYAWYLEVNGHSADATDIVKKVLSPGKFRNAKRLASQMQETLHMLLHKREKKRSKKTTIVDWKANVACSDNSILLEASEILHASMGGCANMEYVAIVERDDSDELDDLAKVVELM